MRKSRTISIEPRTITVRELKVKEIRRIMEQGEGFSLSENLSLVCDLPPAELEDLTPSEAKILWEAVREVNADFFDLLEKAGVAESIRKTLREILNKALSDSLAQVT